MSYSNFTPNTEIEEAQDATGFKIWDKSTWSGESDNTTLCIVRIAYTDDNDVITAYDDYPLIAGADKTKFNEYLSSDGLLINLSDLTIGGLAPSLDKFPDGYYEITTIYDDGTYNAGTEPYYKNVQAFLAKYRCMKRTMPSKLLSWPISEDVRIKNYDIYSVGLYLDAAEDAADLGLKTQFRKFIALIRQIFDFYTIPDVW